MSETALSDHFRRVFAIFDARHISAVAEFATDDVRLGLGNAETITGKAPYVNARTRSSARWMPSGTSSYASSATETPRSSSSTCT
jgi:hypothetical protein